MMKTAAKPSTPSVKDAPKPAASPKPAAPMAPVAPRKQSATPSVTQPAGHQFRAPRAPSATPSMPSASKRLDKTP